MLVALIISGQGEKYNINIKSTSLFKTSIK